MKLLIKKFSQSKTLGTTHFKLYCRLEVNDDERAVLHSCNLLYDPLMIQINEPYTKSVIDTLFAMRENKMAKVFQAIEGHTFSCERLEQLILLEYQIKESALKLQEYLTIAENFGGEELFDLKDLLEND